MAEFEQSLGRMDAARKVFERANRALEGADKEERLMLLEAWRDAEAKNGEEQELDRYVDTL